MSIKVACEVEACEVDGKDCHSLSRPKVTVTSHGIYDSLVVIEFDGKRFTVAAKDIQAAVANATRTKAGWL